MPGQCPGECGRRIAGCDACPTQKGRHPPKRGTPALPLPACLLHFSVCIVPVRTAGRCDKNLSCSFFEPAALPPATPAPFRNSGPHRLNAAFQLLGVYKCYPARRRGAQALTAADTGLPGFRLWCPMQKGDHWQRMARQKAVVCSQIF